VKLEHLAEFRREVLAWFAHFRRDLPWRRTRDPYSIWLSEIMLQQTRVAAVIPYFERFLHRFPTVEALANAPEPELLAHWAGLGYYDRARNLRKAAQTISASGSFPRTHAEILALPGIGDYTAAAISSIAFNLPFAVLDGNVFRVLSRLFADPTNIASTAGKKRFAELASHILDQEHPGDFNQAMMELGATLCLLKSPQCLVCPVSQHCQARAQNRMTDFPVNLVPKKSTRVDRTLYWIQRAGEVLVWQRPADSRLMAGFWELPEASELADVEAAQELGLFRHGITVYDYRFKVVTAATPQSLGKCVWINLDALGKLPLSTIFRKALRVVDNQQKTLRVNSAVGESS
jgi:A/G-specific adenine glycosylase